MGSRSIAVLISTVAVLVAGALGKEGVHMELKGMVIPNNSLVNLDDIGFKLNEGLRCFVTIQNLTCCGKDNDSIAQWFDPSGRRNGAYPFRFERAGISDSTMGHVTVYLRDTDDAWESALNGIYHCILPSSLSGSETATLHVGIYHTQSGHSGVLNISAISYKQQSDPPVFTLTCTSTGGPATIVTWALNGTAVPYDANHVLTQTVIDPITAEYNNTLTVTGREPGNYQCTVSNIRGYSTSSLLAVTFTETQTTDALQPTSTTVLVATAAVPTTTAPCDCNNNSISTIVVGAVVGTVLLVVIVASSVVLVLLRRHHLSTSPQNNTGVEMVVGLGAISVGNCVAYELQSHGQQQADDNKYDSVMPYAWIEGGGGGGGRESDSPFGGLGAILVSDCAAYEPHSYGQQAEDNECKSAVPPVWIGGEEEPIYAEPDI